MKNKKKVKESKLKVRNSRKVYIPAYLMIIILVSTLIYIQVAGKSINDLALKIAIAFSIIVLVVTELHRLGNSYEIGDNSLIHKKGYFTITFTRLQFGAISDSDVRQNPWQRLFHYGNVEVHLFSKENRVLIRNINKPSYFVNFLHRKIRESGGRRGIGYG